MVLRCAATLSWSHVLMLVLCLSAAADFHWTKHDRSPFHYGPFPAGFSWAAGSSAYQTEGAWDTDAKGVSNWESFSHKMGQIIHTANQDCSYEGYCKVKEDISLLTKLKLNFYCFSLSWAWIFPTRRKADPEKGINHNDAPINGLLENWITPVVTVYHWDLSESLQGKYGGWQNEYMVYHFNDFASLRFERFRDRVKYWITFHSFWSISGDEMGEHVLGLKLRGTGPYRVANHIGKAHAKVWHSYNAHWCSAQKGRKNIQQGLVSSQLPAFSSQGKSYIKGNYNFLGISHFILYAGENFPPGHQGGCLSYCGLVDPCWPDFEWLYSLPCGIHRLFNCVKTQIINLIIEKTTCPELCGEWMMQYFRESINKMLKELGKNCGLYCSLLTANWLPHRWTAGNRAPPPIGFKLQGREREKEFRRSGQCTPKLRSQQIKTPTELRFSFCGFASL
ncbi:lactase-like protein isoform X3 [Anguilla rostrata]|uniref:lactase-like protein isoform X3 n=1 Tax=Anguilla rostrata TaxID=7938 RepID=UPI0030D2BB3A